MRTCNHCGDTFPDFDVAHVCSKGQYAPKLPAPNLRKAAQELLMEYDAQRFVSIFHTQIEALRAAAPGDLIFMDGHVMMFLGCTEEGTPIVIHAPGSFYAFTIFFNRQFIKSIVFSYLSASFLPKFITMEHSS